MEQKCIIVVELGCLAFKIRKKFCGVSFIYLFLNMKKERLIKCF
jgi:hypothetical protein